MLLVGMGRSAGFIDVWFENYSTGQHLAIDVTIVSPFRSGVTLGAASKFFYTGDMAYVEKLKKYNTIIFKQDTIFKPFVMEEFGAVHKEGMEIFNRLCTFIVTRICICFHKR